MYQYQTRSQGKAIALFISLTNANHACSLGSVVCSEHGPEGYLLGVDCTEAEFKEIRYSLAEIFPSTNKDVEDMPQTLDVPDHLPDSF